MRMRALLSTALVALVTVVSLPAHAAPITCGGTAPKDTECSVTDAVATADNLRVRVKISGTFVGVVQAAVESETGYTKRTCVYQPKPPETEIIPSCTDQRDGIIYKDQPVTVTGKANGKPGIIPAIGSWLVETYV